MPRFLWFPCLVGLLAGVAPPQPASAIPLFAHRYGLSCQACHTAVPHLTAFGEGFRENGYRLPGVTPKPAFPVSVRTQTAYSSAPGATPGGGPLPRTIVDEVEFLTGGPIGSRGAYWVEAYLVDGGVPGKARDVWASYRLSPDGAPPITLRAGQFTLPLPLDPETFRETTDHYAVWDQTAGSNPFTFFEPKTGVEADFGDPRRALGLSVAAVQGHDAQSGLPARGTDTMIALQRTIGAVSLSAYRYDGSRAPDGVVDRFRRQGYGLGWRRGGTEFDAVYQTGNDSSAGASGAGLQTSGGFAQVRQELGARTFGIARWDATQGSAFARSLIAGLGYRPARNSRLTLFDTLGRDAGTGRTRNTVSASLLVAF